MGWISIMLGGRGPTRCWRRLCRVRLSIRSVSWNQAGDGDDSVVVRMEDGRTVCASLLIGADGFGSRVRRLLAGEKKCQTKYNGQVSSGFI